MATSSAYEKYRTTFTVVDRLSFDWSAEHHIGEDYQVTALMTGVGVGVGFGDGDGDGDGDGYQ
jgi:hypothetical protein